MELKQFLSEDAIYKKVEEEITDWVEKAYEGLSIDFYPRLEVVQIDKSKKFTKPRVRKITEAVNIKIGELLEKHAEEIYIAERLERIYKKSPTLYTRCRKDRRYKN